MVRVVQLEDFRETAEQQGASILALLPASTPASQIPDLLAAFEEAEGLEFLVVEGEAVLSSRGIRPEADVPVDLLRPLREGGTGSGETTVDGVRYFVVGGRAGGSGAETSLFFSLTAARLRLQQLRQVLGVGWVGVVCLAALAGDRVARRALRPVDEAARAAQAMAEGHLDTRLPIRATDEFGVWAASFNDMADALQAQLDALERAGERERRFAGDVAHELRTPLGSLVTAASLIEERLDSLPPATRRPAELLITEARRLRGLVDELLELFRLDADQQDLRAEHLSLRRAVAAVLLRYQWRDVDLEGDDRTSVLADPRHLERVVANLVHNAVAHGRIGVVVRVLEDGEHAVLEVSDAGAGIEPVDLPHLFERFYKVDRSRASGGSGLGLAIAAQNARLIGGVLSVESEPAVGTTFRLRLPLATRVVAGAQDEVLRNGYEDGRPG